MTLICGLPNAGKTTYSRRFEGVIHYDNLKLTTRQRYEHLNDLVSKGNAVLEGVFGERKRRMEFISNTPANERKVCIWLNTPVDTCHARENRGRPQTIVTLHARTFQPPTYDEGWDEIIIIGGNQ